jgi:hypothetical protein
LRSHVHRADRSAFTVSLCFTLFALSSACGSSAAKAPAGDGASAGSAGSGSSTDTSGAQSGASSDDRFLSYIRGDEYSRLEFEVDSVPGLEPSDATGAPVIAALQRTIDKPGGITLRADDQLPAHADDFVWKFTDLSALAEQTFGDRTGSGSIAAHLMFVDGHYEDDTSQGTVLGVAWAHRHIALFVDNIQRSCSSRGTLGVLDPSACQRAESAVWLHEVGHILGLVDNGLAMLVNHRDPDPNHGAHDADKSCVMYWAYDGDATVDAVLTNLIGGGGQLDYCQTNLDDIDAAKR